MSGYASSGEPRALQGISTASSLTESQIMDSLIAHLADRVAAAVAERLSRLSDSQDGDADWLDSRHAAKYLGIHRDTLRRIAAERAIPSEQDGPGCKLWFRRTDLDAWRNGGGRPRHLSLAA